MMVMPDSPGKWKTFALGPVSKTVWVHIAFDGPITDESIKKAMLYLESALDWAPPEPETGVGIESAPPDTETAAAVTDAA